ncbi:hypothetical protein PROFUN_01968 [Planoprotostelium fungivorum]|uniref:Uncharacterized protein n=1 Tax=Planoprotostelium fungivorum TaxID=1890364 RepID=A0A2P6NB00_9EUKA|nr:hypothetical protein PROFUN_01968 [Planoprotostelium fungivorum]
MVLAFQEELVSFVIMSETTDTDPYGLNDNPEDPAREANFLEDIYADAPPPSYITEKLKTITSGELQDLHREKIEERWEKQQAAARPDSDAIRKYIEEAEKRLATLGEASDHSDEEGEGEDDGSMEEDDYSSEEETYGRIMDEDLHKDD